MIKKAKETLRKRIHRAMMIWARTIDHRVGHSDSDKPDFPVLTIREAYTSMVFRSFLVLMNVAFFVIFVFNTIHHW
jgi:hypothetical protein